ncbi:Multidrug resistance protein pgp-3 [Aphelenchoides bicaudatus]|nr:Multidrug resistance protein pgp-3 [Aphelenchoides bicaudatus]
MKLTKSDLFPSLGKKPTKLVEEDEIQPASFRQMMRYATRNDWILLCIGSLLTALNGAVFIGILIVFGYIVDIIIKGQSQYDNGGLEKQWFRSELLNICWIYVVGAVVIFGSGFPGVSLLHLVSERQIHRIKQKFLFHVLNQDVTWLDKNEVGKLTQKMTAAIVGLITGVLMSFIINWRISVVMLIFLPLLTISIYGSGKVVKIFMRKENIAYQLANAVAEEVLSGIRTVASFNAQEFELNRYGENVQSGYKSGARKAVWSAFFAALYNLIIFGAMAVVFWYGSNLVLDGYCTPGTIQGIFWLFAIAAIRIGQAAPHLSSVVNAKLAAGELLAIIDRVPEMDCAASSGEKPKEVRGKLSFQNLHFYYPSRPEIKILNGVSFDVNNGQLLLLATLVAANPLSISLLMRFYDPEQGCITLDGRPIKDLNVEWLRSTIGIVSQEPIVFSGTIEDNLRMGKEDLTVAEMESACRMANAEEFIKKLPKGYQTPIGDGNIRLSGGQKQRLAIARALIRNPKILLLDEATSALDNDSEKIVQLAIDKASAGRTTIIIAHRLSTIRNADKILVFDHGQIVEQGNHEELMLMQNGVYKQLVRAQEIEKAIQQEDAITSDADDMSCHKQDVASKHSSMCRSKKIRRTLEYTSMHSACSSLGAVQFEVELPIPDDEESISDSSPIKSVKPASFISILRFAKPERLYVIGGFILALLRGLSWPIYTLLLSSLFRSMSNQSASKKELSHENMMTGLLFGGLAAYSALLTFASGSMLGNLLRQDSCFYDRSENSVGKLTARLGDAPNVQAALDHRLADVLQAMTSFTIGICAGLYLDWKMALVEIGVVSLILGVQLLILQLLKRRTIQDAQIEEDAARISTEAIQNVRTVQALCRQRFLKEKFADASIKPHKCSIQRGMLESATIALSTCTEVLNFAMIYAAGAFFISEGYVAPITAFQVVSVVNGGIIMSFLPAASFIPEFIRARVSAGIMFRMIEEPTKIDNMSDQGLKPDFHGDIEIRHAYFSYPNQKQLILKDFNIKAYRGQMLALVGPSGCGKSTTIQLLERYYDVLTGSIRIDDCDIREINLKHLRENMALVGQEPTLFNLSVEQNIAYGLKQVTEAQIIEAAKLANIHSFVESLPQKYKTVLGHRAERLSGGQRQRLAIARAVIRNPKILLLDEATWALDSESEKLVQAALENASSGRTCVCIAHRLSTIQHADVIAVVKEGRVIEQGSHQNLLNRKGLYYRLVQKHNA